MIFHSALRFAAAMLRAIAEWASTGDPLVPDWVKDRRRGKCEICPRFVAKSRQCSVCSCFVDLKNWLKTEKCPEGRWGTWGIGSGKWGLTIGKILRLIRYAGFKRRQRNK